MIGTLEGKDKLYWKDFVPTLVHAYNYTQNHATSYSPYFLMFEQKPRLSIDV